MKNYMLIKILCISLVCFIFFGMLVFLTTCVERYEVALEKACKDIDMEKYTINEEPVCIDKNNKAHFVKFECDEDILNPSCYARIISIGNIRTIGD